MRAVVEAVTPQVDCGRFPAKRIAGDAVVVEADCFADGHDAVEAQLLWRREEENDWRAAPMAPLGNDRWRASFRVAEPGRYRYTVRAWVDRLASWRRDLARREDPDDIRVAARVGAQLVAEAAARARAGDAAQLERWSAALADATGDVRALRALALDPALGVLAGQYPDRQFAFVHPELALVVDRERARFGAWYELFPRSTAGDGGRHATFRDLEARLGYVADLGFDVLYLPPIHPIGRAKRKGKNNALSGTASDPGSPWAIGAAEGGHTAIHPDLGTLEDFRRLVSAARAHGLEVALDIAFQCAPGPPLRPAAPGLVPAPSRRHGAVRREPAQEVRGHLSLRLRVRRLARPVARARGGAPVLGRRRRADLPRRQPAHQEPSRSGSG